MREITCLLIRHGKTHGNIEKRYVGARTDESLCQVGIDGLKWLQDSLKEWDLYEKVYTSPMLRCKQTAQVIFPEAEQVEISGLTETDFGEFENKNYNELNGNEEYQNWIDSNGKLPFPGGESRDAFVNRTLAAFTDTVTRECEAYGQKIVPFVIHGGSIMAIMSALTGHDYYDFQIQCGQAYLVRCLTGEDRIDVISYDRICDRCDT